MLGRILKNFFSLFSSQVAARLFGFTIVVILSRYLGVEKFGQYSFVLAFVALFSIIADLGISQLVIREVSKDKTQSQKYLANFFIIQIFLSLLNVLLIILLINILHYSSDIRSLVYVAAIGTAALSLGIPFSSIISAYEKMYYGAIVNIISTVINVALVVILVLARQEVIFVIAAGSFANIISALLTYYFFKKVSDRKLAFRIKGFIDTNLIRNLLKLTIPFALLMGFNTIYNRIDITMLSKMQGDEAVGYYSAAYRLINFLAFIPLSFSAVLFPILSRSSQEVGKEQPSDNPSDISFLINKSLKYIIAIGVPAAVGISLLSVEIINFIYGPQYLPGSQALRVLVWMVAILCFYSIITHTLVAIGKVMALALANGLGVIVNIGLNLIFIPRWGFVGASWTTIIAEVTLLIASYYLAHRYIKYNEPIAAIIKILAASGVMAIVVIILKALGVYFIFNILIAACVYFAMLWVLKFIDSEEKTIIARLLARS